MPEIITGTHTTSGSEWSLWANAAGPTAQTTPYEAEIWIDTSDLAGGEMIAIRQYEKVRSADTQRLFDEVLYIGAGHGIVVLPLHCYRNGYDTTIAAVSGTPDVTWSVRTPGT